MYVISSHNSVVEIDPVMRKVVRSVKVLREPKSAVFSKDGKYYVCYEFPARTTGGRGCGGRLRISNRDGGVYESERYPIGEW